MSERKEICENCRYWDDESMLVRKAGMCRKHPPTIVDGFLIAGDYTSVVKASVYPETYPTDWCGDWFKGVGRG